MNIVFYLASGNNDSSERILDLIGEYHNLNPEAEIESIKLEDLDYDTRYVIRAPLTFYHLLAEEKTNNDDFFIKIQDLTNKLV